MLGPNTFVVGCAKAGTSAICSYLRRHHQAFVPRIKEPDWYAQDLGLATVRGIQTIADYRSLYGSAEEHHLVRVDGSPSSLLSEVAAARIAADVPDARIVILLRNPVEVIHSLHSQVVVAGIQPIKGFEAAVRSALEPPVRRDPLGVWTRYFDVVRLASQVQRYLDAFPREQVHIVRFDELCSAPASTWSRLQSFLGLDPQTIDLSVVNPNTEAVVPGIQRLVFAPEGRLRSLGLRVLPPAARRRLRTGLVRLNVRERPRSSMDTAVRALVLEHVRPEIDSLGTLLGWDLRDWLIS